MLMLTLILFPLNGFAYSYTGSEQCNYYVEWRWGGTLLNGEAVFQNAFQQALTDWNNSQNARRYVNGGSDASGALDTYSEKDGKYGNSIWYTNLLGCVTSWVSKINRYYSLTHEFTPARSTANHELGHILGLAHTNNPAIMNTSRNRYSMYTPQTDDINGVNNLY